MNKLDRYHIDVYIPEWGRTSMLEYIQELKGVKLSYTKHAKRKLKKLDSSTRKIAKDFINSIDLSKELYLDYVFEFYAVEKSIKRACFRFPMPGLEIDIILVISYNGNIVTIYWDNNINTHIVPNISLYNTGDFNMRALLLLRLINLKDLVEEAESTYAFTLTLKVGQREYLLCTSEQVLFDNQTRYLNLLDKIFNEIYILKKGIPGIKLYIDEAISINGEEFDCGIEGVQQHLDLLLKNME